MYGWRGRIGLIVASTNGVVEMEAYKMLPRGVSVHFTRIPYQGTGTEEAQAKMLTSLEACAKLLAGSSETVEVDVIGFAHGSATAAGGKGYDKELNERIARATGVPGITMSSAVIDALRQLGVKRVSIASPFHQLSMLERFKAFLEDYGFEVLASKHLTLDKHQLVSGQPPTTAYQLMKSVNTEGAEAIVMNNPNIRTLEIIEPLENDLGKPVITGNQALMWSCLRKIGVKETMEGLGRLFLS